MKTDIVSRVARWFDHNRFLVLGLVIGAMPIVLASCGLLDGRVQSSITGESSTALEIRSGAMARVGEFDADLAGIQREMDGLKRRADETVAKRQAVIETANLEIEAANTITEDRVDLASMALKEVAGSPVIAGALGSVGLGGLMAIGGLALDNRRKDRVIKTIKQGSPNGPGPPDIAA